MRLIVRVQPPLPAFVPRLETRNGDQYYQVRVGSDGFGGFYDKVSYEHIHIYIYIFVSCEDVCVSFVNRFRLEACMTQFLTNIYVCLFVSCEHMSCLGLFCRSTPSHQDVPLRPIDCVLLLSVYIRPLLHQCSLQAFTISRDRVVTFRGPSYGHLIKHEKHGMRYYYHDPSGKESVQQQQQRQQR